MAQLPKHVRIVEVGPRDGLQNETQLISPATKVEFIERLANTGLTYIEAGSFVNPKWVPQMADSEQIFSAIDRKSHITYAALTPNIKGFERAMAAGVKEVAIFTAASESFSQKNINCSIAESIDRFAPVMAAAKENAVPVRAYVSCVVGCPYEGDIEPAAVAHVSAQLLAMGCYEVSLGDTIGVGTPQSICQLLEVVGKDVSIDHLAVHLHDTYGQALANIYAALQMGVTVIDSSIAGLGGCPYAPGASGNVATEDLVYMLNGLSIDCGVDLAKLIAVGNWISETLQRHNHSKVANALTKKK